MAKFASIITLLFVALVLFAAIEAPTMVGAEQSRPWERSIIDDGPEQSCHGNDCSSGSGSNGSKMCKRPSGTLPGVCKGNIACRNQCLKFEKARHGSCNSARKCTCYFRC